MLKYKALYKKMTDDLKDSDMWLDWAKELEESSPEVSKFLYTAAKERLTVSFPQTMQLFEQICKADKSMEGNSLKDLLKDNLNDWYENLERKLKKM